MFPKYREATESSASFARRYDLIGWKKLLESLKNLLSAGESFPDNSVIFLLIEAYQALYRDMIVTASIASPIHMMYEDELETGEAARGTFSLDTTKNT